jgi:TP901 family phage tail tape measure protein
MSDITQKLGFDATQAISSLRSLDSALKSVNTSLVQLNTNTGNYRFPTQQLKAAATAMQQLANQAKAATQAFQQVGQAGGQSGRSVTLSWETATRVIATQALVRGLNEAVELFNKSSKAAADFEVQVARIGNIAEGPGSSIPELTEQIKQLSIELGRPLPEVGTAVYEALQNDIGTTAETFEILRTSGEQLARVTGGTLPQAVNAISSAIKSYNLTLEESTGLGGKFFAAIDKGRITLAEFESSLGTILPLAREAGISFDEAVAAFTSITRSGTTASVAITQVRNILDKTLKPTDELRGAFDRLGVKTFAELVARTGSFKNALKSIFDQLDNDAGRVAKAFNTIRGNLGILNLSSAEFKEFDITLDALANSADRVGPALDSINQTDARRAEIAFNKLNVIMTEIGDEALHVKTIAAEAFLGIVSDSDRARVAVGLLTGATVTLTGRLVAARLAAFGVSTAITSAISPMIVAATVGAAIGVALVKAYDAMTITRQEADALAENLRKVGDANIDKRLVESLSRIEAGFRSISIVSDSVINETDRKFDALTNNLSKSADTIGRSVRGSIEVYGDGLDRLFDKVDSAIKAIPGEIDKARQTAKSFQDQLIDFNFEESLRGTSTQVEATRRLARAEQELGRARQLRAKAGISEEDRAARLAASRSSVDLAREAQRAALATKNSRLIAQANQGVNRALSEAANEQLNTAKQLGEVNRSNLQEQKLGLQQVGSQVKDLRQQISDLQNPLSSDGSVKTFEQISRDAELAAEKTRELVKATQSITNSELFSSLGLSKLSSDLGRGIVSSIGSTKIQWDGAVSSLQDALSKGRFRAFVEISDRVSAPTGNTQVDAASASNLVNPADRIREQEAALESLIKAQEQQRGEEQKRANAIIENSQKATNAIKELRSKSTELFTAFSGGSEGAVRKVATILEDAQLQAARGNEELARAALGAGSELLRDQAAVIPKFVADSFIQAKQSILDNIAIVNSSIPPVEVITDETVALAQQKLAIIRQETENAIQTSFDASATVEEFNKISTASASAAGTVQTSFSNASRNTTVAVGNIGTSINNLSSPISNINRLLDQMVAKAVQAAREIANANAQASSTPRRVQNNNTGGAVYRSTGGPIGRGADTQLVAATPGEVVVNARQSRNFYSQLQAINAGQAPAARTSSGGNVTNIGDVNVNIKSESAVSAQSGRELAQALRRELRRNTSRL